MAELALEVENVGGFVGKQKFGPFRPGLNVVRAPNAVGKTSLIRALELLALSEGDLRGRAYYSNLFVGSHERIGVKLSGAITFERQFRRIADEDLRPTASTGPGIIPFDGKRVSAVCFAIPGNPLIDDIVAGKPIRDYIEVLAGTERYDKALAVIEEIKDLTDTKLREYERARARLKEMEELAGEHKSDLEDLRRAFSKMPALNEREIFEDYGKYQKKLAERNGIESETVRIRSNMEDVRDGISRTEEEVKKTESQIALIRKKYPRVQDRLSEIARILPTRRTDLEKVQRQQAKANDKLQAANRNEQLIKKHGDGVCYACGKKMSPKELDAWMILVKEELKDLAEDYKKLSREIEDVEEEQRDLKDALQELGKKETDLKKLQRSLSQAETDLKTYEKTLQGREKQLKELQAEIEALSTSKDAYSEFKRRDDLRVRILTLEEQEARDGKRIAEAKKATLGAERFEDRIDFLEQATRYLEQRKGQVIETIRTRFNAVVTELYKRMGFLDFEAVEITPDFRIRVTRERKGKMVESFPLEALATSERITIAVSLLLAAKREYVPEFPFFVLDELVTSYDPGRFATVKDYLSTSNEYIVLTELSKSGDEVVVAHET